MPDHDAERAQVVHPRRLTELVRGISLMIDGSYPRGLDQEARTWRRVMKIAEETGEVTEALLGALGENPRKGITHTFGDVQQELLDVALAALGAVAHLGESDPVGAFNAHTERVYARLNAVVNPPASTPEEGQR